MPEQQHQHQQQQQCQHPPSPTYEGTPITSPRSLRQLSIFLLGSTCLLATTAITRKAVYRRTLRLTPPYFSPNTNPHEYFSPFSDACQALNLATLNCASLGVMVLGGVMWAFDVAGLGEARTVLRGRLGYERIYGDGEVPGSIGELLRQAGERRIVFEEGDNGEAEGGKR